MATDDLGDRTLAEQCQEGDEQAFGAIFQKYGERLVRLANKRISERLAGRIEAEDVVQSVFRTFFHRAQDHRFTFEKADDLWKLLVSMTLNKLRNKVDFHTAAKRNVGVEQPISGFSSNPSAFDPSGNDPSPEAVVAFLDLLENFMQELRPNDRKILELKLQGWSQQEISREMNLTDRTIRRTLERVRAVAEGKDIRGQLRDD